jgi:N utilization substance protein B
MINRRYLRIKVYHALYAYWQSDNASAARIEKEMLGSIERTTDIFLSLVQVIGELRHQAQLRIEDRLKKKLPTEADLKPSKRFVDHPLVKAIAENERIRIECEKRKVSWVGHGELFQKLLREVEADEAFQQFLNDPEPTFKKDQAYLVRLFTEHIANHESLQEVFESRSIHWLEDLDLAATMAKRAIESVRDEAVIALHLEDLERDMHEDQAFARQLFRKSVELGEEHEAAIAEKASNWESDRIALTDMILMKMALAELRSFEQIPVKVTLNEYIEIAKAYSTPKSKNFINGVLDKLVIEMRSDERIRKVGRGLLES